jgi:hypothetical protein
VESYTKAEESNMDYNFQSAKVETFDMQNIANDPESISKRNLNSMQAPKVKKLQDELTEKHNREI